MSRRKAGDRWPRGINKPIPATSNNANSATIIQLTARHRVPTVYYNQFLARMAACVVRAQ